MRGWRQSSAGLKVWLVRDIGLQIQGIRSEIIGCGLVGGGWASCRQTVSGVRDRRDE